MSQAKLREKFEGAIKNVSTCRHAIPSRLNSFRLQEDLWEKLRNLRFSSGGNSLAVRVPSAVARSARFSVGQPVEVIAEDSAVVVKPVGEPKLTLAQKLALFDPVKHGDEVMATGRVGVEAF